MRVKAKKRVTPTSLAPPLYRFKSQAPATRASDDLKIAVIDQTYIFALISVKLVDSKPEIHEILFSNKHSAYTETNTDLTGFLVVT